MSHEHPVIQREHEDLISRRFEAVCLLLGASRVPNGDELAIPDGGLVTVLTRIAVAAESIAASLDLE
jgi:hypothetical protein